MQTIRQVILAYTTVIAALSAVYLYLHTKEQQSLAKMAAVTPLLATAANTIDQINRASAGEIESNLRKTEYISDSTKKERIDRANRLNTGFKPEKWAKIHQQWNNLSITAQKVYTTEYALEKLIATCAQSDTLETLRAQSRTGTMVFPQYMPVITLATKHPEAGKPILGTVQLQYYYPIIDSTIINFSVNQEALPVEKGVGTFQDIFTQPGVKTYYIVTEITNPATRQTEQLKQEMTIHIDQ
jgi:hypothetical protein